jgi:hypothetical protein
MRHGASPLAYVSVGETLAIRASLGPKQLVGSSASAYAPDPDHQGNAQ